MSRSYLGHSVCCTNEQELYQWLAALSHAQVTVYTLSGSRCQWCIVAFVSPQVMTSSLKPKLWLFMFIVCYNISSLLMHVCFSCIRFLCVCLQLCGSYSGLVLDYCTHAHTHTHLTVLCPGLPGWASTRKVKPIWILLKQETVSGSGISWDICKFAPRSRQITVPAPHRSVFYRLDALPATQPTVSSTDYWLLSFDYCTCYKCCPRKRSCWTGVCFLSCAYPIEWAGGIVFPVVRVCLCASFGWRYSQPACCQVLVFVLPFLLTYWFCIVTQRLDSANVSSDSENMSRTSSSSGLQAVGALDPATSRFRNIASKFQKLINRDR